MLVDPATSAAFAAKKGSTPVVLNAPADQLDECNKVVLETLKDPARQKPNPHNTADEDWFNATWDVVDRYWTDPNMTDESGDGGLPGGVRLDLLELQLRTTERAARSARCFTSRAEEWMGWSIRVLTIR